MQALHPAETLTKDTTVTEKKLPLAERKVEALRMRKAGYAPTRIARDLGFRDAAAVDKVVAELLAKDAPADSGLNWHDLELARVDDVHERLTLKMENGERGAERDLMKLMEYRHRLQSSKIRGSGRMVKAVEEALEDLSLSAADAAAKQAAIDMALMIDVAIAVGTAEDQRRAINGMATMRNLLADLGATPRAREELDGIVTSGSATRRPPAGSEEPEEGSQDPEKGPAVLSFMERAQRRHKGIA